MADEQVVPIGVVPISKDGKYVIIVPRCTSKELGELSNGLREWMKGSRPFFIVSGDVKLVRVDEVDEDAT